MGFPAEFKIPVSDTQAYKLLSRSAVVPMVDAVAQCIASKLKTEVRVSDNVLMIPSDAFVGTGNWTREQLKLAFHFYCQTPFGKLDSRNRKVIELATLIGRTPGALAMKLVNFASLDPVIVASGRAGLSNASNLDRAIWDEFHADWEGLALECAQLRQHLLTDHEPTEGDIDVVTEQIELIDYTGQTRMAVVQQRIKQQFFRRAVLSSYRGRCCMSGVADSRLLVASHIVPWREDKANRLNPSNGLCLSAIHDRAFDQRLITLSEDLRVMLSRSLHTTESEYLKATFHPLEGQPIQAADRFAADRNFIARHRDLFLQQEAA